MTVSGQWLDFVFLTSHKISNACQLGFSFLLGCTVKVTFTLCAGYYIFKANAAIKTAALGLFKVLTEKSERKIITPRVKYLPHILVEHGRMIRGNLSVLPLHSIRTTIIVPAPTQHY